MLTRDGVVAIIVCSVVAAMVVIAASLAMKSARRDERHSQQRALRVETVDSRCVPQSLAGALILRRFDVAYESEVVNVSTAVKVSEYPMALLVGVRFGSGKSHDAKYNLGSMASVDLVGVSGVWFLRASAFVGNKKSFSAMFAFVPAALCAGVGAANSAASAMFLYDRFVGANAPSDVKSPVTLLPVSPDTLQRAGTYPQSGVATFALPYGDLYVGAASNVATVIPSTFDGYAAWSMYTNASNQQAQPYYSLATNGAPSALVWYLTSEYADLCASVEYTDFEMEDANEFDCDTGVSALSSMPPVVQWFRIGGINGYKDDNNTMTTSILDIYPAVDAGSNTWHLRLTMPGFYNYVESSPSLRVQVLWMHSALFRVQTVDDDTDAHLYPFFWTQA